MRIAVLFICLLFSCSTLSAEEGAKNATEQTIESLSQQVQELSRVVAELKQKIAPPTKKAADPDPEPDENYPLADMSPAILRDSQLIAAVQHRTKRRRYQKLPQGQKRQMPNVVASRAFPYDEWLPRASITFDARDHNKPFTYFEAIEPFTRKEIEDSALFWQFLAGHRRAHDMVSGGGGYRWLTFEEGVLFGVNSFFDYQGERNFGRLGIGLEAQWPIGALRINGYCPSSKARVIHRWDHYREREHVLRGVDVELELPVPYIPWTLLYANTYYWDAHHHKDRSGGGASLLMYLTGFLRFEAGWNCNAGWRGHHGHKNAFFMTLTLSAGRPEFVENTLTDALFSETMFVEKDLRNYLLQNVRRERQMILERNFRRHHREHRTHHKTEIFIGGGGRNE